MLVTRAESLAKRGKRLAGKDPDIIAPGRLPSFLRAVVRVLEDALDLEAEASGVRKLEYLLE